MGIERELHVSTPYEFLIQVNFKLKGFLDILQYRSFRFSALVKKGWQNLSKCRKLKGYLDVLQYQSFRFWALVKKGWQNLWKSLFSWVFHLHGWNLSKLQKFISVLRELCFFLKWFLFYLLFLAFFHSFLFVDLFFMYSLLVLCLEMFQFLFVGFLG